MFRRDVEVIEWKIAKFIKTVFLLVRSSFFGWLLEAVTSLYLRSWRRWFFLIFSVILFLFLLNDDFLTSNQSKILIKNLDWFISARNRPFNILFRAIFRMRKTELIQNNDFLFFIQVFYIIKFMTDLIEKGIHRLIGQRLPGIFWPWDCRPFGWRQIL